MKKLILLLFISLLTITGLIGFANHGATAKTKIPSDTIFKAKNHSTVYYMGSDEKRYVFPNLNTFLSWYDDFSQVEEVDDEDLAEYPLAGNVRYKPGVLLVKIQTDPKVYAVGNNGRLRWIKTETIAQQLYGQDWNLLVDDVPDTFFTNYSIGDPIEDEDDFDSEQEEEQTPSIAYNLKLKIKNKIHQTKMVANQKFCNRLEKIINRIQKRLTRQGINLSIGQDYLNQCVGDDTDKQDTADDDQVGDDDGQTVECGKKKVTICHIPPGNPNAARSICVGKLALKAHLAHGDFIGACEGDEEPEEDTTPPIISNINIEARATSSTITWTTDEESQSEVEYATESLSIASTTTSMIDETLVTSHSIKLTALTPETMYYFIVKSTDTVSNVATSSETTFVTLTEEDTTPPVISDIQAGTAATSTIISWTTDEDSTSKITYATESLDTVSTTLDVIDNTMVTSHSLNLTNLATSTLYYYKVESRDEADNLSVSDQDSFTTSF